MTENKRFAETASDTNVPAVMTAVVQRGYGSPEVLHLEQVAVPSPEAGHVLIRVAAAGLDRGVWHVMAGSDRCSA